MKRILLFVSIAFVLCFCAMTSQAQAQATRTWVSGVGDDVNPCSRTAPCKTFAGAISKTADCGEIDVLDPGGFGAVTITKGIKIDGGGGEAGQIASILASSTNGITINNTSGNATCNFDVIRNLDINGAGSSSVTGLTGINVLAGKNVALENVDIENFTQTCINFQPTSSMNLLMYNTNFENCAGGGIISNTSSGVNHINIEKSTISRSGVGVTAHANSNVNIHNSMVSNNVGGGVLADTNATAQVNLDHSTVANNQVFGVHATSSAIIRMSNTSVVFNNGTGLLADASGQILTWSNVFVDGNSPNGGHTGTIVPQ
jgi:hypothetical protein